MVDVLCTTAGVRPQDQELESLVIENFTLPEADTDGSSFLSELNNKLKVKDQNQLIISTHQIARVMDKGFRYDTTVKTIQAGTCYRLPFIVEAPDGISFTGKEKVSFAGMPDLSVKDVRVDGARQGMRENSLLSFAICFCTSGSRPDDLSYGDVLEIQNYQLPKAGETESDFYQKNVGITVAGTDLRPSLYWVTRSEGEYPLVDVIQPGTQYIQHIALRAPDGYKFSGKETISIKDLPQDARIELKPRNDSWDQNGKYVKLDVFIYFQTEGERKDDQLLQDIVLKGFSPIKPEMNVDYYDHLLGCQLKADHSIIYATAQPRVCRADSEGNYSIAVKKILSGLSYEIQATIILKDGYQFADAPCVSVEGYPGLAARLEKQGLYNGKVFIRMTTEGMKPSDAEISAADRTPRSPDTEPDKPENGHKQIEYSDPSSGIKAFVEAEAFDSAKADLKFQAFSVDPAKANLALKPSSDEQLLATYDIFFFHNGKKVQPKKGTKVRMRIPIPKGVSDKSKLKIYHIVDNQKREEMTSWIEEDMICFEATSFSYYQVVEVKSDAEVYEPVMPPANELNVTFHQSPQQLAMLQAIAHNATVNQPPQQLAVPNIVQRGSNQDAVNAVRMLPATGEARSPRLDFLCLGLAAVLLLARKRLR